MNQKVRTITAITALLTQMLKNEQVLTLPKESVLKCSRSKTKEITLVGQKKSLFQGHQVINYLSLRRKVLIVLSNKKINFSVSIYKRICM